LSAINSFSQDVQFSQFYAAPTFLNPAYVGGVHTHRAIFQQRVQWPAADLGSKFLTSLFSYDNFSHKYRSGYGVMFLYDYLGSNIYTNSEIHAQYSYELPVTDKFILRPGLQVGMASRNLNYNDLSFPSMFDDVRGQVSSGNPYYQSWGDARKMYADVGSGIVGYTDNLWVSFSGHHLNRPNQSVIGNVSRLPAKFSFGAGYKFHLKQKNHMAAYSTSGEEFSISPVFHYKFQGKSDQAETGLYVVYNQLLFGTWYRGIPFKRFEDRFHNHESIVFIVGWMYNNWCFSYSYDKTISTLSPVKTRGAHEINVTYIHHHKKHKPRKRLPCPSFYKN
jgi:type IX secretion system PorP/SprF family membrane protein